MTITVKELKILAEYWRIFVCVGILIIVFGSIITLRFGISYGNSIISVGIGLCSLGFAFLSVVMADESTKIAKQSKRIAKGSDDKMESLANYHLSEIKGVIEDRRLTLQKHIKKLSFMAETNRDYAVAYDEYHTDYSYSMWKTYTNLQQVTTMLKYSTPTYQNAVIDYLHKYFDIVKKGRDDTKITIDPEHKKHIRWSYNIISGFPAFNQYKERKKLLEVMQDITS